MIPLHFAQDTFFAALARMARTLLALGMKQCITRLSCGEIRKKKGKKNKKGKKESSDKADKKKLMLIAAVGCGYTYAVRYILCVRTCARSYDRELLWCTRSGVHMQPDYGILVVYLYIP